MRKQGNWNNSLEYQGIFLHSDIIFFLQFWSWHWQINGKAKNGTCHDSYHRTEYQSPYSFFFFFFLSRSWTKIERDWELSRFLHCTECQIISRPNVTWINKRVERSERRLKFGFHTWMLLWRRKYLSGSQLSLWKSMAVQIITTNDQNTTSSIQYQEVTLFKGLL